MVDKKRFIRIKKMNFLYLFLILIKIINSGFCENTKIKVNDNFKLNNFKLIKNLTLFDKVISYNFKNKVENKNITRIISKKIEKYILIRIGNEEIRCGLDQKFFVYNQKKWVKAENLKKEDILFSKLKKLIKIDEIEIINEPLIVYEIGVLKNHNFLIGDNEILVHNFGFLLSICFAFGDGIEFAGIAIGLIAAGVNAIINWMKDDNELDVNFSINEKEYNEKLNYGEKQKQISCGGGGGDPDPEDPDGKKKKNKHCRNRNKNQQKEINNQNRIKEKMSKTEFFEKPEIKNSYKHYRGEIYVLKNGCKPVVEEARYLRWYYSHSEVEIFKSEFIHLGAISPETYEFVKKPKIREVF
jgi:hypothetical protein